MNRHSDQHGSAFVRTLFLFIAIVGCLSFAVYYQHGRFQSREFRSSVYMQRTKLPTSQALRFLTLGYDNIYADWLWLQSIQQFGSGWLTEDRERKERPIFQYFDTLTDVDPHFISAYRFANLIIGDQRGDYELGQEILRKGCFKNQMNYDLPYLGVYNAMWSANDPNGARWFAHRLQRIPDAPNFMKRMMEYVERKSGRYDAAYEFNIRYLIEYISKDNTFERDIALRRTQDLLDRLYHARFREAIERYREKNGTWPRRMEDLLTAELMPPYEAPTLRRLRAALEHFEPNIDAVDPDVEIPEDLVAALVQASQETIVGLPPEPEGTWFFLSQPLLDEFLKRPDPDLSREEKVPFIVTARDMYRQMNFTALEFQGWLMSFYEKNDRQPTDEEVARWIGRDLLGGHWVYQRKHPESPKYGVYYSTSGMRYEEKREPRLGLYGPGPFPLPLEPRLQDFIEDIKWGIEYGYLGMDGSEFWQLPQHREQSAVQPLPIPPPGT